VKCTHFDALAARARLAAIVDRPIGQDWPKYTVHFEGGLGVTEDDSLAIRNVGLGDPIQQLVRLFNEVVTSKVAMVLPVVLIFEW